jgi:hypothetical protein
MVLGSSYSSIYIQSQTTSKRCLHRLRCTNHARARSAAAFRWRWTGHVLSSVWIFISHVYGFWNVVFLFVNHVCFFFCFFFLFIYLFIYLFILFIYSFIYFKFSIFREPTQRKTSESCDWRRISKWLLTQLCLVLDESQSALCSRSPSSRVVELKFAP